MESEFSTSADPSERDSLVDPEEYLDEQNRPKSRKAYTITKQRENWTDEEHSKFLEALKLFDRDWKKIEKFIGTKTVIQIRIHAQKYFLKVQKNNTGERIPPPRPKRKSSHPYPQKSKETPTTTSSGPWINTNTTPEPNPVLNNPSSFAHWMASNGLLPDVLPNLSTQHAIELQKSQQEQLQHAQLLLQQAMATTPAKRNAGPDFAKIYTFLGSLFDPTSVGHEETLNAMNPVDRETIQFLMHNLAINLANQQFKEQHVYLLDKYRQVTGNSMPDSLNTNGSTSNVSPNPLLLPLQYFSPPNSNLPNGETFYKKQ